MTVTLRPDVEQAYRVRTIKKNPQLDEVLRVVLIADRPVAARLRN